MDPSDARLAQALRLLRGRGFEPAGHRHGVRHFEGLLPCRNGAVRVRLSVSDWDFMSYPTITVLDGIQDLPALLPHVSAGGLCYFANGSVVLDRYDPAQSIAQCLDQAQAVLDRIRHDASYRLGDVQDEFMAHWLAGQSSSIWRVLVGAVDPHSQTSSKYCFVDVGDTRIAVIADNLNEVAALATALGSKPPEKTSCPCWLFRTDVLPSVPDVMPSTVKALFAWLKQWDSKLYNRVQRVLEREKSYLKFNHATFAVHTPIGWLGFGFDLDPYTRIACQRRPVLYRQHLHGKGGSRGILRLSITEFGPDFVHSRNLHFKDLKDKRITLVGCGAIGSYVAQALVRLGAGIGRGRLTLIDPDTVNPANLGRHVLGYPALFKPKAQALCDELSRQFPFSNIESRPANVQDVPDLFSATLVIDATGEESVSEFLNAVRIGKDVETPLLHVWIKGNGQAVQALWTQKRSGGCFRCLRLAEHKNYREERFKLLKDEPIRKFVGCLGFTPYAVAAPMHAATLCTEMVVDWLQRGTPSPRFRTRATATADVHEVKNQDLSRLPTCPACGTNHVEKPAVRQQ